MMRRQKVTMAYEEQNTQNFLAKLESIKQSSKQIKDKSKFTVHKTEWAKEFHHLSKVYRSMTREIADMAEMLDLSLVKEIEDYQIFGRDEWKTFKELNIMHEEKVDRHTANLWFQLDSLKTIVSKVREVAPTSEKMYEIQAIKNYIGAFLLEATSQALQEEQEIGVIYFPQQYIVDDELQMQLCLDEVKGFDLGKNIMKKMREQESSLENLDQMFEKSGLYRGYEAKTVAEFKKAMGFLQYRFKLEIYKIEMDYYYALNFDQDIIKDSENFAKLNHIYNCYIGRGKDRLHYFYRLTIEFPQMSRKTLDTLTSFIEARIYKTRKLRALYRDYWREKSDLVYRAEQQITNMIEQKLENARREAERLQRKEYSLKIAEEIKKLRVKVEYKKLIKAKELEEKMKMEEEQKKKDEKIWKYHVYEVNEKNKQFQAEKMEKNKAYRLRAQQEAERERLEKQKILIESKPKVQMRQSLEGRKIQSRLDKKYLDIINERQKEYRIERAIQGYEHRPNIPSDPKRLQKPTQSLVSKKVEYDKADKIDLVKVHGYNITQLMSDMRYRLSTALQDAGLANAQYARYVLNQMSRPQQP